MAVPLAIAYLANEYSSSTAERGVEGRFVELAVTILTREPVEDERRLREWAASVLDRYSGVKLPDSARSDLVGEIRLPAVSGGGGFGGYQGMLAPDSDVRVTVTLDHQAQGPALAAVSFAGGSGESPRQTSVPVPPGGFSVLELRTGKRGLLRVVVDAADESSGGSIQVTVGDSVIRSGPFRGDETFVFSVGRGASQRQP